MTENVVIETIKKRLQAHLIDSNFYLTTKIGVIMIVLVTYRPLYTSNLIPALIIYSLLSYYKRKTEMPEKRKKRIIYGIMVLALFVAFNTVLQIFPVPAAETAWGSFTVVLTDTKVTLAMCNIGQFIIFTGALQALIGLKKMDPYSSKSRRPD